MARAREIKRVLELAGVIETGTSLTDQTAYPRYSDTIHPNIFPNARVNVLVAENEFVSTLIEIIANTLLILSTRGN